MTTREKLQEMRQKAVEAESLGMVALIDEIFIELDKKVEPTEALNNGGKKVMILNATQESLNWRTHFTLFKNYAVYGPEKIGLIPQGQTVIHEARNMLAQAGLQTDSEWFIMGPDDDLVLPCGSAPVINGYFRAKLPKKLAALNAITRLMSHPADKLVVGALYFVKGNPSSHGSKIAGRAVCSEAFKDDAFNAMLHRPKDESGLIKQEWVALGWCRIHRSVFEEIIKAIPGRWPELEPSHKGGHYGIFQPMGPDVNEDISFGRRCQALGIDHWLDSGLVCGHYDGTTGYWPYNARE